MTEQDQPHPAGAGDDTPAGVPSWVTGSPEPVTEPTAYPAPPSYGGTHPTVPGPVYGTYQSPYAPQGAPTYATPQSGAPYGSPQTGAYGIPYAPPPGAATATIPAERRSGRFRIGVAGLVAGAVIGGGAGAGVVALTDRPTSPAAAAGSAQSVVIKNPGTATAATAAAAKAAPSVVTIYVANGSSSGSGSGVVLTDDGYVLTNNHVVTLEGSGTGTVQVRTADGTLYDATVVGTDPSSDLGVVKLTDASNLTPATFADSDQGAGRRPGRGDRRAARSVQHRDRRDHQRDRPGGQHRVDPERRHRARRHPDRCRDQPRQLRRRPGQRRRRGHRHQHRDRHASPPQPRVRVARAATSASASPSRADTANRIAQEIIKTGKATHALLGVSARTAAGQHQPRRRDGRRDRPGRSPAAAAAKAGLQAGDVVTAVGSAR